MDWCFLHGFFKSDLFVRFFLLIFAVLFSVPYPAGAECSPLVFSLIFYAWGEPKYVLLLMFMALTSWFCALQVEKSNLPRRGKLWVFISSAIDIALIGYFKYAGLFCSVFGNVPEFIQSIALPIGISFYTFQLLTYVVDVYRGDARAQKSRRSGSQNQRYAGWSGPIKCKKQTAQENSCAVCFHQISMRYSMLTTVPF